MFYTTEYASNFVWHENAYKRPILYVRNCKKKLLDLNAVVEETKQTESHSHPHVKTLQSLFHNGFGENHHRKSRKTERKEEEEEDENHQAETDISKKSWGLNGPYHNHHHQQQQCYWTTTTTSAADARGIKSHFLPATIKVLLELGINGGGSGSSNSDTRCEEGKNDQYFTSVYKQDYRWLK